jgi:hypothetical protein
VTDEARFLEMIASLPFLAFALLVTVLHLGYLLYAMVADTVAWFRRLRRRYRRNHQVPKAHLIKKRRRSNERPHRYGDPQGQALPRRRSDDGPDLHA